MGTATLGSKIVRDGAKLAPLAHLPVHSTKVNPSNLAWGPIKSPRLYSVGVELKVRPVYPVEHTGKPTKASSGALVGLADNAAFTRKPLRAWYGAACLASF